MPKLRETSPKYKGKPALQQEPWAVPPLPTLPDPVWNLALQSVFDPEFPPIAPSDKEAYRYFLGQWQLIAWSIALNRNPGLLPKGCKVSRKLRLGLPQQAKFTDFLLVMERLCIECHPASAYSLGISDYPNHLYWFAGILLEMQLNNWDALLAGQVKQSRIDEWQKGYKMLRGDTSDDGPIEAKNPCSQSKSEHIHNLIEVCRYKNRHESDFRKLWDKFLRAYCALGNSARGGLVFSSAESKARIPTGSGKGTVALKNPVFESPGA